MLLIIVTYVDKVSWTNFCIVPGDERVSRFRRNLLDFNERTYDGVLSLFSSKYLKKQLSGVKDEGWFGDKKAKELFVHKAS